MKKLRLFSLLLSSGLLASCALLPYSQSQSKTGSSSDLSLNYRKDSSSKASSSGKEDEEDKDTDISPDQRRRATALRDAQLVAIDDGVDKSFKPASNGVEQTNGIGEKVERKRSYKLPSNWSIYAEKTKDEEQDMVYQVRMESGHFLVQLYALDAYTKSPLRDGRVMNEEELEKRMEEDGRDFQLVSDVEIDGKKWHVGIETLPENNLAGLVFYRLEDTGNFDDSLLVGSFIYPMESDKDFEPEALKEVGRLKSILAQLSKDK